MMYRNVSMDSVQDTLLIGSNQPKHNQPYLVSLATIIYRRGEARCVEYSFNCSKLAFLRMSGTSASDLFSNSP